jgi:hypothetical protein
MRLYWNLQKIYNGKQAYKADRAIPQENNCRVSSFTDDEGKPAYRVKLHGNTIIEAYSTHFMVTNAGWATPTTHARIWHIAGVRVFNNWTCKFRDKYRIYDRRRGKSLPMPRAILLHYNTHRVFDAFVQSDYIVTVKPESRKAYMAVCKRAWNNLATRIAIGEFSGIAPGTVYQPTSDKLELLQRIADGEFLERTEVLKLFNSNAWGVIGHDDPLADAKIMWKTIVSRVRDAYHTAHDGYQTEEIKNGE